MRAFGFALSGLVCLAIGCGHDDEEVSAAEDACEHMMTGPAEAVTAAASATDDAPDIGEEHTRFDITLADDGGTFAGFVDVVMDEAAEATIFADTAVTMTLRDDSGAEVAAEATLTDVPECPDVAAGQTFDFEVGTYSLELGHSAATVRLVVAHAGEHDHE